MVFRWGKRLFAGRTYRELSQLDTVNRYYSSKMASKFKLPPRYGSGEKSVWIEYNELVAKYKPKVNLGQGFPDYPPPKSATDSLLQIATDKNHLLHQYTRGFGHPRLVQNLSKTYSPLIGREIDPMNEIIVTFGAYEALYVTILGHVDVGDEVIIIEPFFDCYEPMVRAAGGTPRFIPLRCKNTGNNITSADWVLDTQELTALFNDKTKMIIFNTPHNPIGKAFTREEMEVIADLCKKFNVLCVADEVYEWMVYEPNKHIRMATLPDMWERTVTIGSAGKSFSVTGWKIGWAYGPAPLVYNLMIVHQNCVYTCCTPIQEAVARAFEQELSRRDSPDCFWTAMKRELLPKRDFTINMLKENGFNPTVPEAGYFVMADWTQLKNKVDLSGEADKYQDYKFTKMLMKQAGVVAIPPTCFYNQGNKALGENYARFCFIKQDENLNLASKLLKEWNSKL